MEDKRSVTITCLLSIVGSILGLLGVCFAVALLRGCKSLDDGDDDDDGPTLTTDGGSTSSCCTIAGVTAGAAVPSTTSTRSRPYDHLRLSDDEIRARVRWLFPGRAVEMLRHYRGQRNRGQQQLFDAMDHSMKKLSIQVGLEQWFKLTKPENAVELCVALGLNERVVRGRYNAVGNLQRELGLPDKTPSLVSIRHLVRRIPLDIPYGSEEDGDFDGIIRDKFRGISWLSYLGVKVNKNNVANVVKNLERILKERNWHTCLMHGTTATGIVGIMDFHGTMNPSVGRHDFGDGVYCFKGDIRKPLSFAISRTWPLLTEDGRFSKHNPCVVVFTKPVQFNRREKKNQIHNVNETRPFNDSMLRDNYMLSEEEFKEFIEKRKSWKKADTNWKEFVKVSRCFCKVPAGKRIFKGYLHDSNSVEETNNCREPRIDRDGWIQHCYRDHQDLGDERLFIELDVDWNEWIDDVPAGASEEIRNEMCEKGKEDLEKRVTGTSLKGKE